MYADLHLKYSSKKNAKALIFKALHSGYSVVAICTDYDKNTNDSFNESWKIINCFRYKIAGIMNKSKKSESGNYFIDQMNDEDIMDDHLLRINNSIEENYILVNRPNTLSIKNLCDDFMLYVRNEMTEGELQSLRASLLSSAALTSSDALTTAGAQTPSSCAPKEVDFYLSNNTSTYVLRRLNIKYDDAVKMGNYQKLIRENNFNLIAIEISSPEEADMTATKFDCDIIFFNMKKSFVSLKKTDIQNALDKGIFFEVSSLNTINEDHQHFIFSSNINNIFSIIPLNKIIISSGSTKESEIIEPLNFLRLFFNFNTLTCKDLMACITTVPLSCIQRASVRKSFNTAVFYK
ncbi:ribonuclease P/MRP protein subunit RPP1, putative [Plasmodium malariae]|uniref:Ribonuclease P/MRP protein subunit RPP1, putative n=1 Tax=Plasmodium malariae TaxID=5858 RepID=A0A1C3KZN2_PLAMA|nr:ribonuclease P/MRP protein subunit RPP1, putative [Plasmodium malariae]